MDKRVFRCTNVVDGKRCQGLVTQEQLKSGACSDCGKVYGAVGTRPETSKIVHKGA